MSATADLVKTWRASSTNASNSSKRRFDISELIALILAGGADILFAGVAFSLKPGPRRIIQDVGDFDSVFFGAAQHALNFLGGPEAPDLFSIHVAHVLHVSQKHATLFCKSSCAC